MKKKIIYILTLATVSSIGCFFIGRNTAKPEPETHIDRMEYAEEGITL